jgi:hypothetical protein
MAAELRIRLLELVDLAHPADEAADELLLRVLADLKPLQPLIGRRLELRQIRIDAVESLLLRRNLMRPVQVHRGDLAFPVAIFRIPRGRRQLDPRRARASRRLREMLRRLTMFLDSRSLTTETSSVFAAASIVSARSESSGDATRTRSRTRRTTRKRTRAGGRGERRGRSGG